MLSAALSSHFSGFPQPFSKPTLTVPHLVTQELRSPTLGFSDPQLDFSAQLQELLQKMGGEGIPPPWPPWWIRVFLDAWAHPGSGHPEALWSAEEDMSWKWSIS